jgi:uncharacterized protein YecE (DUF72 family)
VKALAESQLPDPAEIARLGAELPRVVLFGASSWNYAGWNGLVYHREYRGKGASARMLEEYARFPLFRTVGIDSSFYAPPTEEVLTGWARHLPAGFPCVTKVWQQLTVHTWTKAQDPAKAGKKNPDFLSPDVFHESIYQPYKAWFKDHTGPLVFEFQQIGARRGVTPQRFADRLDEFFDAIPPDLPYAVEVRNDEFLTPAYFAVLREHGVTHVLNNWTRMPTIGEQLDLPGVLGGSFIVARALLRLGRTYEQAVDKFAPYDRIQEPNPGLRRDLVRVAETAKATRLPAYILVNNRVEGSAPLTIFEVARLLEEKREQ